MTTHIAGEVVRARGLVVQRCAWCGAALVYDTETSLEANPPPVPEDAEVPHTWPLWPAGAMVQEDHLYVDDGTPELPEDSCVLND